MEMSHQILKRMCEDIDNANFSKLVVYNKYLDYARPMIDAINKPPYQISKTEAEYIIKFYAKKSLMELGVYEDVDIKIFSKEKMLRKYGRGRKKALPYKVKGVIASSIPSESRIIYSEQLVEDISSGNPNEMYRAFRTVLHETKHIEQSYKKEYSRNAYIMALETMAMNVDPYVYLNNYWETYRECDAEKYGMEATQKYFPGICRVADKRNHKANWENFESGLKGNTETIIGRVCSNNGKIILPGNVYPAGERIRIMELIAEEYIRKYPKKALKEYPVLSLAFRSNGKRKSVSELLQEMYYLADNEKSLTQAQAVENMCLMILENRFPYNCEIDKNDIYDFIRSHRMKISFIGKLLKVAENMKAQDMRKRAVKRDFMRFGIGLSRISKSRRKEYFSEVERRIGKDCALQYYLEPEEAEKKEASTYVYQIDIPVDRSISNNMNTEKKNTEEKFDESR